MNYGTIEIINQTLEENKSHAKGKLYRYRKLFFYPSFPRHFRDYLKNGVCQKEINNNNKQ